MMSPIDAPWALSYSLESYWTRTPKSFSFRDI